MNSNVTYGKLADLFPRAGTVVIADDFFRDNRLLASWGGPVLWIHAAEEEKTLATVERLSAQLLELQADRSTFLLGVGGGILTGMLLQKLVTMLVSRIVRSEEMFPFVLSGKAAAGTAVW
ncbi:MAG: hypothetical protein II435_07475, partial [Bacteroidales bacterium]|nr:hypothetical protein [Bacteroidales bacterium]